MNEKSPRTFMDVVRWGISYKYPNSTRRGGDMFPLPSWLSRRSNDSVVEIKADTHPHGLTTDEKGNTKVVSVISIEKTKKENPVVGGKAHHG